MYHLKVNINALGIVVSVTSAQDGDSEALSNVSGTKNRRMLRTGQALIYR